MTRVFLETSDGAFQLQWEEWKSSRVLARTVEDDVFVRVPLTSPNQLRAYVSREAPRDREGWGCFLRTADFLDDPWAFGVFADLLKPFVDACDVEGMREFVGIKDTEVPCEVRMWGARPAGTVGAVRDAATTGGLGSLGDLPDSAWGAIADRLKGFLGLWMLSMTCKGAKGALMDRLRPLAIDVRHRWGYDGPIGPRRPPLEFTAIMTEVVRSFIGGPMDSHAPLWGGIWMSLFSSAFYRGLEQNPIAQENTRRQYLPAADEGSSPIQFCLLKGPSALSEPSLDWIDRMEPDSMSEIEHRILKAECALGVLRRTYNEIAVARAVLSCSL